MQQTPPKTEHAEIHHFSCISSYIFTAQAAIGKQQRMEMLLTTTRSAPTEHVCSILLHRDLLEECSRPCLNTSGVMHAKPPMKTPTEHCIWA